MIFAVAALLPTWAAAQATAPLNDTGQSLCYDGTATMKPCTAANTGNAATYPGQDGRYGRDAAQAKGTLLLPKDGGGAAGFDFTPLDASGNPTAVGSHVCVRDNVTKLEWEVKQTGATSQLRHRDHHYTWGSTNNASDTCGGTLAGQGNGQCTSDNYVAAVNTAGLCGTSPNPWRLPTEGELQSIVHYGRSSPAIDIGYFPNTENARYWWTSSTYAPDPSLAWFVHFGDGFTSAILKPNPYYVRLVRSGQ